MAIDPSSFNFDRKVRVRCQGTSPVIFRKGDPRGPQRSYGFLAEDLENGIKLATQSKYAKEHFELPPAVEMSSTRHVYWYSPTVFILPLEQTSKARGFIPVGGLRTRWVHLKTVKDPIYFDYQRVAEEWTFELSLLVHEGFSLENMRGLLDFVGEVYGVYGGKRTDRCTFKVVEVIEEGFDPSSLKKQAGES